jgi:hypothetical protein
MKRKLLVLLIFIVMVATLACLGGGCGYNECPCGAGYHCSCHTDSNGCEWCYCLPNVATPDYSSD